MLFEQKQNKNNMKHLIINADDFGLHSNVNKGIIKAYQEGCLRSTTLITNGVAAEEAACLARENPELGVGVHFTFVAEKPVLPVDKVRSLIDNETGKFFINHKIFITKILQRKINFSELYSECEAQLLKAKKFGIRITHFDSHQHLHVFPKINDVCLDIAKKYNINKVRFPAEAFGFTGGFPVSLGRMVAKCGLTACTRIAAFKFKKYSMRTPDAFFGMVAGGNLQEEYFLEILKNLPDDKTSEIMIHPGTNNKELDEIYRWNYHWNEEMHSLISLKSLKFIKENDIKLISYNEL